APHRRRGRGRSIPTEAPAHPPETPLQETAGPYPATAARAARPTINTGHRIAAPATEPKTARRGRVLHSASPAGYIGRRGSAAPGPAPGASWDAQNGRKY